MGANACSCSRIENGAAEPNQLVVNSSSSNGFPPRGPEKINTWYFNVLNLDDEQNAKVAAWLLSTQRGLNDGSAEAKRTLEFAKRVCGEYLDLPYHNVRHGVDVLHTVWRLGYLLPWSQAYNYNQQFALMVAAFCHDIGHFGLTNVFLVDMRDELAIRYNDLSPLENMHCNKLFHILSSESTNVLAHMSQQDFASCRKLIIDAILNTDPAQHAAMVQDLTALYNGKVLSLKDEGTTGDELLSELFSASDVKTLGARCFLHAADLSNPSRPWTIAVAWAHNVLNEFFAQGDKEKELGIPIGMLNDRMKVNMPNSQIGFIQFMVAPFVSAYTKVFTKWFDLNTMLGNNVGEWARLALEESGKDESGRVLAVRDVLEQARAALEIKDKEKEPTSPKFERIEMELCLAEDGIISPDSPTSSTVAVRESLKAIEEKDIVAAREVRRWREEQQDSADNPETRQYRELLLIYMLSNGNAVLGSDRDVVLKFSTSKGHFNDLADATGNALAITRTPPRSSRASLGSLGSLSSFGDLPIQVVDLDNEAVPERPSAPRVVEVAQAVDNVESQLTQAEFDGLLAAFLDNKDVLP